MMQSGLTPSKVAGELGVSRQYLWGVIHSHEAVSPARAKTIEQKIDRIIRRRAELVTFGDRLRAARKMAGLTLKETAQQIGYSWVGVERWEKNQCLPKPGVLLHLCTVYGVSDELVRLPQAARMSSRSQSSHLYLLGNPQSGLTPHLHHSDEDVTGAPAPLIPSRAPAAMKQRQKK
jgi:transcriptional regulator with XRE-family HTH domain